MRAKRCAVRSSSTSKIEPQYDKPALRRQAGKRAHIKPYMSRSSYLPHKPLAPPLSAAAQLYQLLCCNISVYMAASARLPGKDYAMRRRR